MSNFFFLIEFATKDHLEHKFYAVKYTCTSQFLIIYSSKKSRPRKIPLSELLWLSINHIE